MARFRFIGKYTNGNESISVGGFKGDGAVVFNGREPAEVDDEALCARLTGHPEFEPADPFDHDGDGKPGGSKAPEGDKAELDELRAQYKALFGKKPFSGWDADKLREKLA